jgi:hypothetical protein
MHSTLRSSLSRSVLLCFVLVAAFGLLAATPNAGQTAPLATTATVVHVQPAHVATVAVDPSSAHVKASFLSGATWRAQRAYLTSNPHGSRYPWFCLLCHLPSDLNH